MSREYKTEDDYEMIPLTENELHEALKKLPDWELVRDIWMTREFQFDDYMDGVDFAKRIGEYAEKRQHHPSITIDYKKVRLEISSWRAKGVTELDIEMIKDFNKIYKGV